MGAIQTVIGGGHVLVFGVLNAPNFDEELLSTHTVDKTEISQVVVNGPALNAGAYSLGLFQVGNYAHDHEGGHSVASATLGPLYLPMVGLSYLVEGHHNSLFEDWADLEADADGFMNTHTAQIGLGSTMYNGRQHDVVVLKFDIEQRQINEGYRISSDKIYNWLNTKVVAPLVEHNGSERMPVLIEFDLLSKKLNLVIDNVPVYLSGDQTLRNNLQTEQRYLHIENIPALETLHVRAHDWAARYGLQYNLNKNLSITPRVGIGASVGAFSERGTDYRTFAFEDKYNTTSSFKYEFGIEMQVFEYATLSTQYGKEYFSNDMKRSSWETQIHNSFRDPFKKIGFIQHLDFGIGHKTEKWETSVEKVNLEYWHATIGIRF